MQRSSVNGLRSYVPRVALEWDASAGTNRWQELEGSLVFVDISGFTALSERLARRGRVGAEELTEVLNHVFSRMLRIAYDQGGSLLKFGGDALLLLFDDEGHSLRAVHSAVAMRSALREAQSLPTSVGRLHLRMSVGIHSGTVNLFRVGTSHRELLISGPAASETVKMEQTAEAGEIVVSHDTAKALPVGYLGAAKGPGFILRSRRLVTDGPGARTIVAPGESAIALGVPIGLRSHLGDGPIEAEHRMATIAFVKYRGLDHVLATQGPAVTADGLHETLEAVQTSVEREDVTFLATDIDDDGGKIILAAGVPRTGEDEEGRMLRAVRRIVDTPLPFTLRVGINRGHVFAGDIGTEFRRTFTVMGDTVNLAARLMAAAQPGAILATADVLTRAHTLFVSEAVPPFMVKGKTAPVQAYTVGASSGTRQGTLSSLPFVGRTGELERLEAALSSAADGRGRVVLIEADRGVGKSRLVDEFLRRHSEISSAKLTGEPYGGGTPYLPFRRALRELSGISDDEPSVAGKRLADLINTIDPELGPLAPLLAPLFGVELAETPASRAIAAEFRLDRAADLLIRFFDFVAPKSIVIHAEDSHWFDETSSYVLSRVARAAHDRPWLVIMGRRPADDSGQVAADDVIELPPIEAESASQLLEAATEAAPLRPHENDAILQRAAGNPLFLEELVRVANSFGTGTLPDSLDSVANTHIDELPPQARLVLRHASVLGNSFDADLLHALLDGEEVGFTPAIRRQLHEHLVAEGPGRLRFRHALLREASYEGLPFRVRRALHGRAALAIERQSPDQPERHADVLSLHFFHAQDWEKTWRYGRLAGQRAREVFAHAETVLHLERALEAARHSTAAAKPDVAGLWSDLGDACVRLGYFDYAERGYRQAAALTREEVVVWARYVENRAFVMGEHQRRWRSAIRLLHEALRQLDPVTTQEAEAVRVRLLVHEGELRSRQGRYSAAIAICEQVIDRATLVGEFRALATAYRISDEALVFSGRSEQACYALDALRLYEQLGDLAYVGKTLGDLGATSHLTGKWREAADYYRQSSETAQRAGDLATVAVAETNLGELLTNQGHLDEAQSGLRRATRIAQGLGYPWLQVLATMQLGRVAARLNFDDEALELLLRAVELDAGDGPLSAAEPRCYLAEAHVYGGRPEQALEILDTVASRSGPAMAGTMIGALFARVGAMALAAAGDPRAQESVEKGLLEARSARSDFDTVMLLDLRNALAESHGAELQSLDAVADERDRLVHQLGIVELPVIVR